MGAQHYSGAAPVKQKQQSVHFPRRRHQLRRCFSQARGRSSRQPRAAPGNDGGPPIRRLETRNGGGWPIRRSKRPTGLDATRAFEAQAVRSASGAVSGGSHPGEHVEWGGASAQRTAQGNRLQRVGCWWRRRTAGADFPQGVCVSLSASRAGEAAGHPSREGLTAARPAWNGQDADCAPAGARAQRAQAPGGERARHFPALCGAVGGEHPGVVCARGARLGQVWGRQPAARHHL
mmetsp:Transcript_30187/g.57976  ORF Transcript_30187/g.57976 Transcript_30187/m.57976 type:complete len:234 (-) Transcript_30187:1678-2379(-)